MKKNLKLMAVFFFLLNFGFAFGWGKTGHRVVAEIAEHHLSGKAKREIAKIIGKQPLAYWANYPDFIKSDPESYRETSSWHYLDFPEEVDRTGFDRYLKESTDKHLYKRVLWLIDRLKNREKYSEEEQIRDLYFLVHLIGDAHQPLHLGREQDMGGNRIKISWFGEQVNLHSLWDDELVDFQKYSYTEYAQVLDCHDKKYNQNLTAGTLEDWLYESYLNSEIIYSSVKEGDKLKYRYDYDHLELMEMQLLKGGLRLSVILNEIFG